MIATALFQIALLDRLLKIRWSFLEQHVAEKMGFDTIKETEH